MAYCYAATIQKAQKNGIQNRWASLQNGIKTKRHGETAAKVDKIQDILKNYTSNVVI